MEQKIVNRLPSKTWNWLKVNEAVLDWDNDRTTDLGAGFFAAGGEENEPIRVEIEGKGEYSYKAVNVTAKAGSRVTVYEIFRAEANLAAAGGIGVGLRAGGQRIAKAQRIAAVKSVPLEEGEAQQPEGRYRGVIPVDRRPVGLRGLCGPFVARRGLGERRAAANASELSQLLQLQKITLYGLCGYVQRAGG